MLALKDVVAKYLELAGEFGEPVPLSAFGLSREDTERLFSALDEDYHISRFLAFSNQPSPISKDQSFSINGFPQTHLAISGAVREGL